MRKRYIVLIISILMNSFGNSLMIKGSVGATPWSASYSNISNYFGITPGTASICVAIIMYVLSKIIAKDFKLRDAIICVLITVSYGYLIDFYLFILGRDQSPLMLMNYFYAFAGVIIASCAVSLTIQANVGYMALDDFVKNLKFHICKGNIALSMFMSSGLAILVSVVVGSLAGSIVNITFLTLLFLFGFGFLISIFDKLIVIKFDDAT